ncbi:MAG: SIS domain-containing protein, partial [Desulfobacteraceae bacterium]|nr:SIS domain-containing protein [Desulfobacteraceae bacterium]
MCGLAGILSITDKQEITSLADAEALNNIVTEIEQNDIIDDSLWQTVQSLKREANFIEIYKNKELQDNISELARRISDITEEKTKLDNISPEIEKLKDIEWCLTKEIQNNIEKVRELAKGDEQGAVRIFRDINAVLNSIDRLEVRGRDSAGITLMFVLEKPEFEKFRQTLDNENLLKESEERSGKDVLLNRGISINGTAIAFTYKIAAEIGSLGDNTAFLRDQIKNDPVLHILAGFSHKYHTVSSHTRWASVGAITEPNCHPVDSKTRDNNANAIIHVCLNGDIDNYLELKQEYEPGSLIHEDITTDTKIIPLQIEKYFEQGFDVEESFRLAVNSFHGSHAICMQTDLVPGKIFLAQKGSGQAIFVGLAEDHYMSASEVYGFVEETPYYLKMDGEKTFEGKNGRTQGQIFVLDQESAGGLDGIRAMFYDGTPVALGQEDIQHTKITSRDIDRQDFPHYFLKEISEAPGSVEKTLHNRWKTDHGIHGIQERLQISLDEKIFPESLKKALADDQIRRVFFIGQGTAGVAAQACASVLNYYMDDPSIFISSMKASEMSGFNLRGEDAEAMSDTLIVAISQSGTTTDTNRTVDMVKERGAHTLAIVNRRDSDITFKVDGVMYTSSGRDVEMSVASTKAF